MPPDGLAPGEGVAEVDVDVRERGLKGLGRLGLGRPDVAVGSQSATRPGRPPRPQR